MQEQREFVRWWRETVSVRESPGRSGIKSNADQRSISKADAEAQTGITHQQVSKWRKRLAKPDQYRAARVGTGQAPAASGACAGL